MKTPRGSTQALTHAGVRMGRQAGSSCCVNLESIRRWEKEKEASPRKGQSVIVSGVSTTRARRQTLGNTRGRAPRHNKSARVVSRLKTSTHSWAPKSAPLPFPFSTGWPATFCGDKTFLPLLNSARGRLSLPSRVASGVRGYSTAARLLRRDDDEGRLATS